MSPPPQLQMCETGCSRPRHAQTEMKFPDLPQIASSQHLDAKKVLLRVPMEAKAFLETRALLLERLGRHQDALE